MLEIKIILLYGAVFSLVNLAIIACVRAMQNRRSINGLDLIITACVASWAIYNYLKTKN
jgi:hypothetical protein